MKNLKNLEIINLNTVDGKLVATVSFQDPDQVGNLNNGYDTAFIPVNLRELQKSVRGNILVNQSVKEPELNGAKA